MSPLRYPQKLRADGARVWLASSIFRLFRLLFSRGAVCPLPTAVVSALLFPHPAPHGRCFFTAFGSMGRRLKEVFGSKVAFGLEGGYNLQVCEDGVRCGRIDR